MSSKTNLKNYAPEVQQFFGLATAITNTLIIWHGLHFYPPNLPPDYLPKTNLKKKSISFEISLLCSIEYDWKQCVIYEINTDARYTIIFDLRKT